jgi:hypothetical protein
MMDDRLVMCGKGPILVAAFSAAGCMSYKPVPPLDDAERTEAASLAPRLATERVRVVGVERGACPSNWEGGRWAADRAENDDVVDFRAAAVLAGGAQDDASPTIVIEVRPPWRSFGEPMLNVLTLGFVPDVSTDRCQYEWRLLAGDGRTVDADVAMESPSWTGWLVGPIALLPGWRLSATWKKDEQEHELHSDARRERLALALARSVVRLRDAMAR